MQPGQGHLPTRWRDSVSPPPDLGGPHHSGFGSEVCQCACFFELTLQYLDLPFLEVSFSLCVSERQRCLWHLCMFYYIRTSNGHNYHKYHLTLSSCQTMPIWTVWTRSCYRFLVSLL